jgi:hypothetical protein
MSENEMGYRGTKSKFNKLNFDLDKYKSKINGAEPINFDFTNKGAVYVGAFFAKSKFNNLLAFPHRTSLPQKNHFLGLGTGMCGGEGASRFCKSATSRR